MSTEISRKDLYAAVWDRPVRDVAAELNISDVALGKICRRHQIPVPGRGYWARLRAGKRPHRPRLQKQDTCGPTLIFIRGSQVRDYKCSLTSLTEQFAEFELSSVSFGPQRRLSKHAEQLQAHLQSRRADGHSLLNVDSRSLFRVCISKAAIHRTVIFIDELCKFAEAAGFSFMESDHGVGLRYNKEFIPIQISEIVSRMPHARSEHGVERRLQPEVHCALFRRERRMTSARDEPTRREWDLAPSGRLEVQIDNGEQGDGLRRKFADGKTQRIEEILNLIIESAILCTAAASERRARRIRLDTARHEARRFAEQQQWQEAKERERVRLLQEARTDWVEAYKTDIFVCWIRDKHKGQKLPEEASWFLAWCERHAEDLRQRWSINRITRAVRHKDLMGDEVVDGRIGNP